MSYNINTEQTGRSMVEMLGVLAIIGVLSIGAIAGYSAAMQKHKLSKTKDAVIHALTKYADLTSRRIGNLTIKGADSQENAIKTSLIDDCDLQPSAIPDASDYKVCKLPLGEQFIKVEPVKDNIYSYMYFLSFVPGNVNACVDILSAGWQSMLPEDWWKTGRISITPYDNTQAYPIFGGKAYTQRNGNSFDIVPVAYIKTISAKKIADACSRACKEENPYCTIVFDFIGYN